MKVNNEESKVGFVVSYILYSVLAMILYKLIFRCIDGYSLTVSRIILWTMLIVSGILGIAMNLKKGRNDISIFMNLSICFGLYTVWSYWNIVHKLITVTAVVTAVLVALFGLLVLARKIRNRERFIPILQNRLERVAVGTQFLTACGMLVILTTLGMGMIFGRTVFNAETRPATEETVEEYTIDRQIDTLVALHEENWKNLTVQERLDVLQVVANIEQRHLGTSTELNVGAANLDECMNGYYDDYNHRIVIRIDLLQNASPWVVLQTVCHEAYHSYQHRLVDLYEESDEEARKLMLFDDVRKYKEEFSDYADYDEDFDEYYCQRCESTAREYAKDAMIEYYSIVHKYVDNP